MFRRFILLWLVGFVVSAAGVTAKAQTLDDTGLWFALLGNGELPKTTANDTPLLWWFDAHYRLRDDAGGFNQAIVRPGLGLKLTDTQAIWAGYAWIPNSPVTGADFDEQRFWQQWTATPTYDDLKILHRSRFEQRWVETGDDVGLRWRQMLRGQLLITDCPQWSLIAWDEVFLNFNDTDWGAKAGLDQNRAFLGVGYKRCPHASVRTEVGYLNQFINNQGGVDGMNHILSINFFF